MLCTNGQVGRSGRAAMTGIAKVYRRPGNLVHTGVSYGRRNTMLHLGQFIFLHGAISGIDIFHKIGHDQSRQNA